MVVLLVIMSLSGLHSAKCICVSGVIDGGGMNLVSLSCACMK